MYKAITILTLIAASSAEFLPNGCPSDFLVHHLLPHESDCSKYYSCSNGKKIEKSCVPGTLFDVNLQVCNWDYLVDCPHPPPTSSSTEAPSTPPSTASTTKRPTDFLPNGCPSDFSLIYLIPHETDCGKFYSCSNGKKVLMTCAAGTWFDYETQRCDFPHLVNCTPGSTTTTTTLAPSTTTETATTPTTTPTTTTTGPTTTTEGPTTTTEGPTTTTEGPEFLPNGCPADFSIDLLLPHEADCGKFYSCVHGNKVEMECPVGLWFDVTLQYCSWPFMVQCNVTSTTTSSTTTTSTTTTTTETTTTTTEGPEFLPNGCPADFSVNLLLPHESDCGKFYSCVHGEKVEMDCVPGTWFDFELQYCSWPFMVNCNVTSTTTTTTTTTQVSTTIDDGSVTSTTTEGSTTEGADLCPPGVYGNVPHPTKCNAFYLCVSGVPLELYCASGYEFDADVRECVPIAPGGCTLGPITGSTPEPGTDSTTPITTTPDNSITTTEGPEICPIGVWGHVPHPTLCNSFYMCAAGSAIQLFCSEGFEFDPNVGSCVLIAEGGCTMGQTTTPASSTFPPEETTTVDPGPCPPGTWGNVPHPELCNSFYLCTGSQEILQLFCSEGFEFDPVQKTCVAIAEGGCTLGSGSTAGPGTTPDSSQSTTTTQTTTDTVTSSTTSEDGTTTTGVTTPDSSESFPDATTTPDLQTTTEGVAFNPCPEGVFGNVPNPNECSSYFLCVNGEAIPFNCAEGLEYDPESKTCVVIAEGGCTMGPGTPTQSPSTPDGFSTTPANIASSTQSVEDAICSGVFGTIPHPELCNSFYICDGDKSLQLFCVEGYEYDPESKGCVEIAEGGCTLQSPTTTEAAVTEPPICPEGLYGNIPHPQLCNAFYMCTGGQALELFCSEGFEFDPESRECAMIAEGGCTLGSQTTPATDATTTVSSGTTTDEDPGFPGDDGNGGEDENVTTTVAPTTESPICPPDVFGNVPHPDRCDAFYFCSGGNAHLFTCSEGMEFDRETKLCVPIAEGGCTLGQGTTPGGETTVPDVTSTAAPDTTTVSDDGSEVSTTTEAITEPTTVADDTSEEDPICPPGVFGNVPHPDRCDAFYFCSGGTANLFTCSEGHEYDPETKLCVPIAEGGCTLGQGTTPGGETTVPDVTSTAAPDTTTVSDDGSEVSTTTEAITEPTTVPDVTSTAAPDTTTVSDGSSEVSTTTEAITEPTTVADDTSEEDPICPPGVFGNVAHPDRCDAFYFCSGGTGMQFNCSAGLEFDPESKVCVPIAEGGCTLGQGTTPGGETTVPDVTSTAAPDTTVSTTAAPEVTVTSTAAPDTTVSTTAAPEATVTSTAAPDTTVSTTAAPETTVSDVTPTDAPVTTTLAPTTVSDGSSEVSTTTEAITEPTTVADDTSEEDPICPPGVFGNVAHPDRCDAFYFCSGGTGMQFNCSAGLEFDPESKTCAPIAEGGCTLGKETTPGGEITVPDVTPTAAPETTVKEVTSTAAPDTTVSTTVAPETTVTTTAAPETTVSTTAAPDTTVSTTAAPETTVTSTTAPETTVSDVTPTDAPVTTTLAPTTDSDDSSDEGSATEEPEPTTVADDTSEEDPICPPGVFGNVPHPDRCDAFYFCSGGNALLVNCSAGLEFDRESMVCAPIVEGRCPFGQVTEAKPDTTTQVPSTVAETTWKAAVAFMCPDNEDRFFADPNSCNRFFRCIEGYGLQMHCPSGEEYDASQEACVPIAEDGCTSKRK